MRIPLLGYVIGIPLLTMIVGFLIVNLFLFRTNLFYVPYSPADVICLVSADSRVPGRAYAKAYKLGCYGVREDAANYVTHDYGQHWIQLSADEASQIEWFINDADPAPNLHPEGDRLMTLSGETIWTFPHTQFRQFFSSSPSYYMSDTFNSMSASTDTLYVALGSYGVLVGPYPYDSNHRRWEITNQGITDLHPPAIRFTNPLVIALITMLGLFVPPLTWIHGWLIGQAWRYMYPEGEEQRAVAEGVRTARVITFFAAAACVIWLTDIRVDFYQIVAAMAVLSVLISVYEAVQLAREHHFSHSFIARLAIATGLLALLVPLAVLFTTIGAGWFVLLLILTAFIFNRHALTRHLEHIGAHVTRWQIDHITLEVLVVIALTVYLLTLLAVNVQVISGIAFLAVPLAGYIAAATYTTWRAFSIPMKQAKDEENFTPVVLDGSWWSTIFFYSIGWVVVGLIVSGTILFLQGLVYGWFITLGSRF